jgi:hypothetical protein
MEFGWKTRKICPLERKGVHFLEKILKKHVAL